MAVIAPTNMQGPDQVTVVETTLGASDTLVFNPDKNPVLILNNGTGGALTPLIVGDASGTVGAPGFGNLDASTGHQFASIGIGVIDAIVLNAISTKLQGTVTITGGDAIVAQLLEF